MHLRKVIALLTISAALIGCGPNIDERVDVSKVSKHSNPEIISSCAMQAANKAAENMSDRSDPLDIVGIDILKDIPVQDELNVIDFKIQFYNEQVGRVIPITITDFRCYASVKAMEEAEERKKKRAIAEEERRHQQDLEAAQLKADQDAEAAKASALAAKRAAEIKFIEDRAAEAAAKYAAELAAKKEAQRIIQYRKEKIEAQKKAEAERIRREKYDLVANHCLKQAVLSDFPEFKKTIRMPSSMKVGSNRTAFLKPMMAQVLKYSVSEGAINIQYRYKAQLFYRIKRNGEIKDGYNTYPRQGSFICDISSDKAGVK